MKETERILCAALYYDNKMFYQHMPKNIAFGIVICGRRHHNCYVIASFVEGISGIKAVQGFITSEDRFVDRKEAFVIAAECGQIIDKHSPADVLISEDLY
jgi:hypothetical protein